MKKVWIFKCYFFIARLFFKYIAQSFIIVYMLVYALFLALFSHKKKRKENKPRLLWGPVPLINNKYYNLAMKSAGYKTNTIMSNYFAINKRDDYDMYFEDFIPKAPAFFQFGIFFRNYITPYRVLCYSLKHYDIFHYPFNGGFLRNTPCKNWEAALIKLCGGKIVVLGYGYDFYRYSKVLSLSWLHGLLSHYPELASGEETVEDQVKYWRKNADCIINGMQIDQLGRWDVLPFRAECIDTDSWVPRSSYSSANGLSGSVKIVHAPNHRVIKGTEFLIRAVEELQQEGLKVELILIEKKPNEEVKRILNEEADIFFDQLNLGYAMSAIEAFAMGLPVMTNLENEEYVRVFRRYSYINECPALSVSHETLKNQLRVLVKNPDLRRQLGQAGRKYAEKYHSFCTAGYMFGKVYEKIWAGQAVNLINMFHPLFPDSYNNQSPLVEHPLHENKFPESLLRPLNY